MCRGFGLHFGVGVGSISAWFLGAFRRGFWGNFAWCLGILWCGVYGYFAWSLGAFFNVWVVFCVDFRGHFSVGFEGNLRLGFGGISAWVSG